MNADEITKLINAIRELIVTIVGIFGPIWTVIIATIVTTVVFLWRRYNEKRKDRQYKMVIEEKDRTIMRMQNENRTMRVAELKRQGWSDEEIDKYIN